MACSPSNLINTEGRKLLAVRKPHPVRNAEPLLRMSRAVLCATIGKAGGNAPAQTEAISRLISLALRSKIAPSEIIEQLKGISGPFPVWEDGELILSTPDAIGKALERYLIRKGILPEASGEKPGHAKKNGMLAKQPNQQRGQKTPGGQEATSCPECGTSVAHESGCIMCYNCGWSRC